MIARFHYRSGITRLVVLPDHTALDHCQKLLEVWSNNPEVAVCRTFVYSAIIDGWSEVIAGEAFTSEDREFLALMAVSL